VHLKLFVKYFITYNVKSKSIFFINIKKRRNELSNVDNLTYDFFFTSAKEKMRHFAYSANDGGLRIIFLIHFTKILHML